jgi:hypothetical protein
MHTLLRCFQAHPMFDAEGGGLGAGSDQNGAGSDGAAGGFADAGNASASFDSSISANAGDYTGGPTAAADPAGGFGSNPGGGLDTSGSFGSTGGATIDLGGGASPSAGTAMQFSASDAATLGALAVGGYVAIATTGAGYGIAATVVAGVLARGDLEIAVSHAAHDIGILGADPALADAPSIGMFGTESQAIDAVNHDGGFGSIVQVNDTGSIWDVSIGGNITITDHVGGHSAYWDNVLGLPT